MAAANVTNITEYGSAKTGCFSEEFGIYRSAIL